MRPLKFASLYAGCGSLARGLVESGHECCFLVESDEESMDVIRSRFINVESHTCEKSLRRLPLEVELLAASLATGTCTDQNCRRPYRVNVVVFCASNQTLAAVALSFS